MTTPVTLAYRKLLNNQSGHFSVLSANLDHCSISLIDHVTGSH